MQRLVRAAVCLSLILLSQAAARSQATPSGEDLERLLERVAKLEAEVKRLQAEQGAGEVDREGGLFAMLETPYLGRLYQRSGAARFFVARLVLVNTSQRPLTIEREQLSLIIDGEQRVLEDVPQKLQSRAFQLANTSYQLRNLRPAERLIVAAGGAAATWMVFADLPDGTDVPRMQLTIETDEVQQTLDVNEQQRGVLGLEIEMIGPGEALALATIRGALNGVNVQTLVNELDALAVHKIARVVLCWDDGAPAPEPQLTNWLVQSATQAQTGRVGASHLYPPLPATIRELHLAGVPQSRYRRYSRSADEQRRLHETAAEAVSAALESAFRTLPREETLKQIRQGHVLARAAALEQGGGRLGAKELPEILAYADDERPQIQRGALAALRHFGEPAAIETLIRFARKNNEPLASAAIESLAGSRFAAAHTALIELLQNEPPAGKKAIVQVLARYPRPIWSDTIFEFVRDSRAGLNVEALRALVKVGHPQLVDVLEEALHSGVSALRNQAFPILVARSDERSETIALDYTLEKLKTEPPDGNMVNLLNRTKDARAIPLLLKHLESSDNKSTVINLLAQIGDQSIAEKLYEKYATLKSHEKAAVLNALHGLHSPRFRELAAAALLESDSSMVSAAAQGLQQDGGPEATRLLVEAFAKATNTTAWSYISNALGQLATPEARRALVEARDSGDANKRRYAERAINSMRQRSPGYQYVYQARAYLEQENEQAAFEQFDLAIEVDPNLPDGYTGRGNLLLKQEKLEAAGKDFEKALELDPYTSFAITGLAVVEVLRDKIDEGIKRVEQSRARFDDDVLYAYNSACVYGRAVESLAEQEASDARDEKLAGYRKKALGELEHAVKLGFTDFEWMQEDPDLSSIRDSDEFRKLIGQAGEAEEN